MVRHKKSPSYNTFHGRPNTTNQPEVLGNPEPRQSTTPRNKADEAAMLARRLGSEGSWADTYAPQTPASTTFTPSESSADDDEEEAGQYRGYNRSRDMFDDPPPTYTPSDSATMNELPAGSSRDGNQGREQNLPALNQTSPVPSRSHIEHETSRTISGTYTLYDLLDLSTQSGSILITIDPQPGDKPAVLKLSAVSGSIDVRLSQAYLNRINQNEGGVLQRQFQTTINVISGSVSGILLHGNGGHTTVEARSGSIALTLMTTGVSDKDEPSTINTKTNSGTQTITVQSATFGQGAITALQASHQVWGSGTVNLYYPREWEGVVHAQSRGAGSVNVRGDGLEYQRNGQREVYAWRGRDRNNTKTIDVLVNGSGTINYQC